MRPSLSSRLLVLAAAVCALALTAGGPGFGQQLAGARFLEPMREPAPRSAAALGGPGSRAGTVGIRSEQLPATGEARLAVSLFAGTELDVVLRPVLDPNEGAIWLGRVAGDPASRVHLRRVGDSVAGTLRTSAGIFQLLPDAAGRAVVLQAGEPALPDIALPVPERLRRSSTPDPAAAAPASDEPSRFDLLVILERRAVRELPGFRGWLKDIVRSSIVDLNIALADSGVNAFFNLQAIKRDRHPGNGNGSGYAARLLRNTTSDRNRRMRKTQRLRRKFGSDIVAVVMARNEGVCGMGWIPGQREGVGPDDGDIAFSVTSWRCLAGGTLQHEIGHNLGAQHAHEDPTSTALGAYDWSYGYKVPLKFRTIMAYSCDLCTPALLFSTPDVMVEDLPAGVAGVGPAAADNARGFEQDRAIIAGWRECNRACK